MSKLSAHGYRLSPQQRRLWLQRDGGRSFQVEAVILLEGPLSIPTLQSALRQVVDRHEILRTSFHLLPGMKLPMQVIGQGQIGWDVDGQAGEALETDPEVDQPGAVIESIIRATLRTETAERHELNLSLPALCADAETVRNLGRELIRAYSMVGETDSDIEPLQYLSYSEWKNEQNELEEATREAEEAWAYWLQPGLIDPISDRLPFEKQTADKTRQPAEYSMVFEPELQLQLKQAAGGNGTDVPGFLLTSWMVTLWLLTRRTEIVPVVVFAGRGDEELRSGMGPIAEAVPVPIRIDPALNFTEQRRQIAEAALKVEKLQEYFNWERFSHTVSAGAGKDEPFSFGFDYVDLQETYQGDHLTLSIHRLRTITERCKINLDCLACRDGVQITLRYDAAFYPPDEIVRLGEHFRRLVGIVSRAPERTLASLCLLSEAERERAISGFNSTRIGLPPGGSVHGLFERQAEMRPDELALVCEDQQFTRGALDRLASRLAAQLHAHGVRLESRVVLLPDRTPGTVIGLLGALKAGAVCHLVEPDEVAERLSMSLDEAAATVILAGARHAGKISGGSARVIQLDSTDPEQSLRDHVNFQSEVHPENAAYVIYTSGSTGRPKGVVVEHRQMLNYLSGIRSALRLQADAHYATVSTMAADLGHTMVFPSLCGGGSLHLISNETATDARALAQYIQQHRIDCLKVVPAHFDALQAIAPAQRLMPLQRLIFGGDALRWDLIEKLDGGGSGRLIFNHYGPTETTVGVLTHCVSETHPDAHSQMVPLGYPIANTHIYLLDAYLQPAPFWAPGDLYVGGDNLARGYQLHPDLTAEKFIPDPFGNEPGRRLYKTGDLGRRLPDGRIEFLGRIDQQVKIRGRRVELGEIEAVLKRHQGVGEALVQVREDESGDRKLVSYIVPKQKPAPTISELRYFLEDKLPEHMRPTAWINLESLPLTPNGKVDRRRLPAPDAARPEQANHFIAPRTSLEAVIADIWQEVLELKQVGVTDNFFELGGHSLLGMQVVSRLRMNFQIAVPLQILFEADTVEALAIALINLEDKPGRVNRIADTLKKVKSMSPEDVKASLSARKFGSPQITT